MSDILRSQGPDPHVKMTVDATVPLHFGGPNAGKPISFLFTAFFPRKFAALRSLVCGSEEQFITSLARSRAWAASGGKSKAVFSKTLDSRYIIKRVAKVEKKGFLECAPAYFEHMALACTRGLPTAMSKIVGIFRVGTRLGTTEVKEDLVVMENLFFGRSVSRVFDLKGSVRNRLVKHDGAGADLVVLQDQNLLEEFDTSPLVTTEQCRRSLATALWNDTVFLSNANIMDYSLLCGIDEDSGEIVVGIIDYIRRYTWDKQLESWVKLSNILPIPFFFDLFYMCI